MKLEISEKFRRFIVSTGRELYKQNLTIGTWGILVFWILKQAWFILSQAVWIIMKLTSRISLWLIRKAK